MIGASIAVLVVLLSSCTGRACTNFYPTYNVGTAFRVKVMNRGRPVKALRVVLKSYQSSDLQTVGKIYSITDANGYASFSNLNSGHFILSADLDGDAGDAAEIEVATNLRKSVTVPLRWPGRKPVGVRSVSGTIRGPDDLPGQVQVPLSISLLEGVSGREVSTTTTNGNGRFNFTDQIPAGIYYLRLNPSGLRGWSGEQIEGMIAIEVKRNAADAELDLDLGWSSCGLGYAQREKYHDITVSAICGDVKDTSGGVISNAQVALMTADAEATVVEQTRSMEHGQFTIREQRPGTYQLLIRSVGFQPYLRVVRIKPAGTSKVCKRSFQVRMNALI